MRLLLVFLLPFLFAFAAGPCVDNPEHRQFDFWLGEWDVTSGTKKVGTNLIERAANGCLIVGSWTAAAGGSGKSLNFYDRTTKTWRQVWVGSAGDVLDVHGEFRDNAMRYEGSRPGPDGATVLERLTFFKLPDGRVRQFAEQSPDGGKSWKVRYDLMYTRRGDAK